MFIRQKKYNKKIALIDLDGITADLTMSDIIKPLWLHANTNKYTPDTLLFKLNVYSPPIDVLSIAQSIGVQVHFVSGAEWDGAVESDKNGNAEIYVNINQKPTAQRFTIAHELGHVLIHEPGSTYRDNWSLDKTDIAEIQANIFAANLLMPSWMVFAYATNKTINDLSKLFRVSERFVVYRLQAFGYNI